MSEKRTEGGRDRLWLSSSIRQHNHNACLFSSRTTEETILMHVKRESDVPSVDRDFRFNIRERSLSRPARDSSKNGSMGTIKDVRVEESMEAFYHQATGNLKPIERQQNDSTTEELDSFSPGRRAVLDGPYAVPARMRVAPSCTSYGRA